MLGQGTGHWLSTQDARSVVVPHTSILHISERKLSSEHRAFWCSGDWDRSGSRAAVFGCGTEDSGLRGYRVWGLGLRGLGVRV